jgi:hypothetical protein
VIGFAIWNSLTLFWTENLLRGVLTAGVIWLLVLAYLRLTTHSKLGQVLPALLKVLLGSAVVMSVLAWAQMVLDIAGAPMEITLTCIGCQFEYFGFPRATALAIEPQFFGSLLLAPILLCLAGAYRKMARWQFWLAGFFTLTLFMTLSRGAIYALAIGILVLVIVNFKNVKRNLQCVGLAIGCLVLALATQGAMVALNSSVGESFSFGVAKSVHHLSLGTIDWREQAVEVEQHFQLSDEIETAKSPDVYFDGYVEESTQARLSFNELAFDAWKSSPATMIFGAGLGDAGVAMNRAHPDQIGRLEITQNQYTEIPLELGIVGLALFVALLAAFFRTTRRAKWTWAIAAAYLAQWVFFSGYPNALHIYLILFVLAVLAKNQPTKHSP